MTSLSYKLACARRDFIHSSLVVLTTPENNTDALLDIMAFLTSEYNKAHELADKNKRLMIDVNI